MVFEMSVTVRNEEKRTTMKHLIYEPCEVSETDPVIKSYMDDAVKEFAAEPDCVTVKITMKVK